MKIRGVCGNNNKNNKVKNKIVFITPTSTQPRFRKRIESFIDKKKSVIVFSFKRKHQQVNDFGDKFNVEYIGHIEDGEYFKRIFIFINSFFKLRRKLNKGFIFYVFGLDLALLTIIFFKKPKITLEIGDIRISKNRLIKFMTSKIEFFTLKKIDCLIVTSPGFKNHYLNKYPNLKVEVIENKIRKKDIALYDINSELKLKNKNKNKITIGVIGLLRYQSIIELINEYNNSSIFDILIIGDGKLVEEIKKMESSSNNIFYYKAFKNPDDLKNIYEAIDVNFVVYDSKDLNVQLALPNKLYESIYYKVPLIVSKNTFLWKEVDDKKIGVGIDLNKDNKNIFNLEEKITFNKIDMCVENMKKVKKEYIIDTN